MSNLIAALNEHKQQAQALDDIQQQLRAVKRAYHRLDDARAKLEEVQQDVRAMDHPSFESELNDLHDTIGDWLEALHPISEDMLDWAGRDDD